MKTFFAAAAGGLVGGFMAAIVGGGLIFYAWHNANLPHQVITWIAAQKIVGTPEEAKRLILEAGNISPEEAEALALQAYGKASTLTKGSPITDDLR